MRSFSKIKLSQKFSEFTVDHSFKVHEPLFMIRLLLGTSGSRDF